MAAYSIRTMLSPIELRHFGPEYLTHIKQKMIRDLAAKMFEVFGDVPIQRDSVTGHQYLEFTMNAWEDHEVAKAKSVARAEGFDHGAQSERIRWQQHVAELEARIAQLENPEN